MESGEILNRIKVKTVLLVDWPDLDIPMALLKSGFRVFSYSPDNYSEASLIAGEEHDVDFHQIDQPAHVDLVCIYRPTEEHAGIINDHVIPLGATIIWLQPPIVSSETDMIAKTLGILCISGHDIRELPGQ
jgi:predicted CoA-binding protein